MLVVGGTALTAVCAQVTIPCSLYRLRSRRCRLCFADLARRQARRAKPTALRRNRAAGAPVFQHGSFGWHAIAGSTGGYILSFAIVAGLLGWLSQTGWTRTVWKTAVAIVIGSTINLGIGALWLSAFIGGQAAFNGGVLPFLILRP